MRTAVFLFSITLGLSAQADFTFKCNKSSKEACVAQLKYMDKGCCLGPNGKTPDKVVKSIENFCETQLSNVKCYADPSIIDGLSCVVKSENCSALGELTTMTSPPQYSCKAGDSYRPVLVPGIPQAGIVEANPVALFCVSKEAAVAAPTKPRATRTGKSTTLGGTR